MKTVIISLRQRNGRDDGDDLRPRCLWVESGEPRARIVYAVTFEKYTAAFKPKSVSHSNPVPPQNTAISTEIQQCARGTTKRSNFHA